MRNLTLAFRVLAKTPFVTGVAILSLALGIGANTAIFSLFHQFLLQPLPVPAPETLVNLTSPGPKQGSTSCGQAGGCESVFSFPMFRDLEREQTPLVGLAAHRSFGVTVAWRSQPSTGDGLLVSGGYFSVLGLNPAAGRLLGTADDRVPGESAVAVLSHAFWRSGFDASPSVINESIVVNGHPLTIVGVAPEGFDGTTLGNRPLVYVPITMRAAMESFFPATDIDNRRSYWAYLFGRLEPGVTMEEAAVALNQPYRRLLNEIEAPLQSGMSDATMAQFRGKQILLEDGRRGQSTLGSEASEPLTILLGVTVFVLLIACANIANLLLARSSARAGEMAVRLSIGAARRQLIGQLLLESCLLALLGGLAGLLFARWTLGFISSMLPAEATSLIDFSLNPTVMMFTGGLAIVTGIAFGLFPALHSTRPNLVHTLKGQAGRAGSSGGVKWFRLGLATSQIALSMLLLAVAGLFIKSLVNISRVDLGIRTDNLVTFSIAPSMIGYTDERSRTLFDQLEEMLAAQPGVVSVTQAMVPLLGSSNYGTNVSVQGFEAGPDSDTHSNYNQVGPNYFRTTGVPVLSGREFTESDTMQAPKVAIVNEAFAEKFDLGRDAVGRWMRLGRGGELDIQIVGLVQNAKYSEVKGDIPPLFFLPGRQNRRAGFMTFYIRTALDPETMLTTIPPLVAKLEPNLPVGRLRTMDMQIQENVFLDRMIGTFATAFASLATLLAAVGLYGVLAYTVAQRTREIGLRMALGAAPARVGRMILGQVGWMTLAGGVVGLGGAALAGSFLASQLFGLAGWDPGVLGSAAAVLTLVAAAAGLVPAMRAARIDPMRALRYE
jgi:predicted permease